MLPTFQVQAKNLSPDKQMALMRQYLNQLKDDTETELYDIKWDNLSKPLRDKLNSLESYAETSQQQINQINANVVKADSIETLVLQAGFIKADYITADVINALHVVAGSVDANWVYAGSIAANQITSGRISANYLDSNVIVASEVTADFLAGKFVSGNNSVFGTVNVQMSSGNTGIRLFSGGVYADVKMVSTSTPNRYQLVVDLPS